MINDVIHTVKTAAAFLKVSTSTLYRYTAEGKTKHYKKEGKLYFFESDLIDFVKSGSTCNPLKPAGHA